MFQTKNELGNFSYMEMTQFAGVTIPMPIIFKLEKRWGITGFFPR
jgi:hypothetical protein